MLDGPNDGTWNVYSDAVIPDSCNCLYMTLNFQHADEGAVSGVAWGLLGQWRRG